MKKHNSVEKEDLRPEYRRKDLGKGIRGKYHAAYHKGTNLVILRPEVAKAFPMPGTVNNALLGCLDLTKKFEIYTIDLVCYRG